MAFLKEIKVGNKTMHVLSDQEFEHIVTQEELDEELDHKQNKLIAENGIIIDPETDEILIDLSKFKEIHYEAPPVDPTADERQSLYINDNKWYKWDETEGEWVSIGEVEISDDYKKILFTAPPATPTEEQKKNLYISDNKLYKWDATDEEWKIVSEDEIVPIPAEYLTNPDYSDSIFGNYTSVEPSTEYSELSTYDGYYSEDLLRPLTALLSDKKVVFGYNSSFMPDMFEYTDILNWGPLHDTQQLKPSDSAHGVKVTLNSLFAMKPIDVMFVFIKNTNKMRLYVHSEDKEEFDQNYSRFLVFFSPYNDTRVLTDIGAQVYMFHTNQSFEYIRSLIPDTLIDYKDPNGYFKGTIIGDIENNVAGKHSLAQGEGVKASKSAQHANGRFNIEDIDASTEYGKYAHIVGNGTSDSARSNAHTLDWEGNAWFAGKVTAGADPTADMDLVTKRFLTTQLANLEQPKMKEVATLPTTGQQTNTIYLVPKISGGYEMYLWDEDNSDWVDLGKDEINLTNYYTKTEADNTFRKVADSYTKDEVDELISGKQNVLTKEAILNILGYEETEFTLRDKDGNTVTRTILVKTEPTPTSDIIYDGGLGPIQIPSTTHDATYTVDNTLDHTALSNSDTIKTTFTKDGSTVVVHNNTLIWDDENYWVSSVPSNELPFYESQVLYFQYIFHTNDGTPDGNIMMFDVKVASNSAPVTIEYDNIVVEREV